MKNVVASSAKFLDKKLPNWAKKIKVTLLTINSNEHCILGQLSKGDPRAMLEKIGLNEDKAYDMGFVSDCGIENLDDLWKEEVRKRRVKK